MKTNIMMKGWEILNLKRRTDNYSEYHRIGCTHTHTHKFLNNKNNQMAGFTTYLSILTLNVNGFNSPIKRYHMANWIKKEDLIICCLQETHLIDRNK
jgi:hypothetical protein